MKKKSIVFVFIVALVLLSALTLTACKDDVVAVTGVTLDRNSLALVVGTEGTLVATVAPEDADNKNVSWSSSNTTVATVSASGVVSALKLGTAVITVTTEDGEHKATCNVEVVENPLDRVVTKTAPTPVYPSYDGGDTLVVGYSYFSSKFSPFFGTTAYDMDVASMTQLGLLTSDRLGNIILKGIEGETSVYNGTEYTYNGIGDVDITQNADGTVTYDVLIRDDIFFSDGVHMTIDDVIFSMYVLSDPNYNGSSTFYALPILGMNEFRTGVTSSVFDKYEAIAADIAAAGADNDDFSEFTEAQQETFWGEALELGGKKFAQEIVDYVISNYINASYAAYFGPLDLRDILSSDGLTIATAMRMWGFGGWTSSHVKNTTGTKGLVGEAYKNLYTRIDDEEDATFEDVDGYFYVAVTAETDDDNLYYISVTANDDGLYTVTKYEDDRYASTFDGGFIDDMGRTYDLVTEFPTIDIFWECIHEAYGDDLSDDGINVETAGTSIIDFVTAEFISIEGPKDAEMGGQAINNIKGLVKTGDYSLTITMSKFDATAIYKLGVSVAPLHYYGNRAEYKYTENKFGFTKGDLSGINNKTTQPMGAGAYKFVKFENGVVSFERNGYYFKGAPKITNIQFRETSDADKISGVIAGTFDITDPSISAAAVSQISGENSNGTLNGNVIDTNLVDNLGYGYIGINANRVKVGTDDASEASKNLRKAYATLFAVHRDVVIDSYYGERAVVINYPISSTSWAAPQPTDEGYAIAYSVDAEGNPIYTANMTALEMQAAAINAAISFFKAAGYTFNESTRKFTGVPTITAHIPADGTGDHPAFLILTNAQADLATIGVELIIQDYANSADFWPVLDGNTADIWCAAWGASLDPDMYQVYHSSNSLVKGGGTDSNKYNIQDDELDQMIVEARASADRAYRKAIYKQALELIMDWGVEVPTYQRKNAVIFSPERVDLETLTPDITTFWGWMNDIESLEMK